MQSEKDKIMELLTITEVKEGGEVIFTDRSIEILQELGQQYKETPLFKKSRQDNPDWEGDANAGLLFVYMCERLTEAPSRIHTMIVCIIGKIGRIKKSDRIGHNKENGGLRYGRI